MHGFIFVGYRRSTFTNVIVPVKQEKRLLLGHRSLVSYCCYNCTAIVKILQENFYSVLLGSLVTLLFLHSMGGCAVVQIVQEILIRGIEERDVINSV